MTDPQRLTRVFVELVDALVDDFDVVDFLTMLAHRCVELLGATEAGVVLVDEQGALRSVASSDEAVRLLDLFELQKEEGPCFDCYRSGELLANVPLTEDDERWPVFGPEARRMGFSLVHALPMRVRGHVIGAVNVFAVEPAPLAPSDIALGQGLADIATVGIMQGRSIREARLLNQQLQLALTSRVVIEQAKGMLAERCNISLGEAFEMLRGHARRNNQRLSDVAQALLDGRIDSVQLRAT